MADIKQAAEWLKEGKSVRRAWWGPPAWISSELHALIRDNGHMAYKPMLDDLLADDWEIAAPESHKGSRDDG